MQHVATSVLALCLAVALLSRPAGTPAETPSLAPRTVGGKALYARTRAANHPPRVLGHARRAVRAAAVLVHAERDGAMASGVLVAPDLLLVARHGIRRHGTGSLRLPVQALGARFDVLGQDGARVDTRTRPVVAIHHESETLDYALLRLASAPNEAPRAVPLVDRRLAVDDALFLVHAPRGEPLQIGLDAWVLFPSRLDPRDLDVHARRAASLARTAPHARRVLQEFLDSHVAGPDGLLENRSVVFGRGITMGIEADAFQGSSGAGVWHLASGELVGILVDGAPDRRTPRMADWDHHERVLPAHAILRDLARAGVSLGTAPR